MPLKAFDSGHWYEQVAYGTIKSVSPNSKILLGGLAHENPPEYFNLGFLDDVLAAGGGQYLDIVNVHYYSSQSPTWARYGDDIAGKVGNIRQTLASFGIQKPVIVTESSWTSSAGSDPGFSENQARYVPKLFARGLAADVYVVIWFSLADWAGADVPYGLLDQNLAPKASYRAYQIAATEFGNANSVRKLTANELGTVGGVEAYAFNVGGQERWVLWAEGSTPIDITLPARAKAAMDKQGTPIALANGLPTHIQLDASPVYVRL